MTMNNDFEVLQQAALMLTGDRPPILIKDVQTEAPMVRRFAPVLGAGDFDFSLELERREWQGNGCDPDTETPLCLDRGANRDVVRLIPEDGETWADALKVIVAEAFGRLLDDWAAANGFTNDGRRSATI